MADKVMQITLEPGIHEALRRYARASDQSMASAAVEICRERLMAKDAPVSVPVETVAAQVEAWLRAREDGEGRMADAVEELGLTPEAAGAAVRYLLDAKRIERGVGTVRVVQEGQSGTNATERGEGE